MGYAVRIALVGLALIITTGCGRAPSASPARVETPPSSPTGSPSPTPSPRESATASARDSPRASARDTATPSAVRTPACPAAMPNRLSLHGEHGRAFAFAPLTEPDDVTVEGEVDGAEAWSTSKVLVVAAFLATTADGEPEQVSSANRSRITAALTRSDAEATRSLRSQIPGSPGRAMTAVLRAIGDTSTTAPDSLEGTMSWTIRQQVRFMSALDAGEVVSRKTSGYLLKTMRPIEPHRWGLGRVGATAFKGGWLRQGRVTRQLGLLDGYAVAIITDRGPVVRQTDGDSAHVEAMDELAELLADRLAYERRCG